MEQKEAEKEIEITEEDTGLEKAVLVESLAVAETASAIEEPSKDEPEPEQALLPIASGVGHRLKRQKTVKTVVKSEDAGELAEVEAEEAVAETEDGDEYPLAAWRTRTQASKGLGRGGLAAVVLLVIFVPAFIALLFLLYSNTERLDAMRKNLADFNSNAIVTAQNSASTSPETALVQLLNRPNVKVLPLKVENLSPTGQMVFYTDGNALAFSYGNLDPLNPGQMYSIWISTKPAGSSDAAYVRLANLPDDRSTGRAVVVNRAALPSGFNLANFSEIFVTVEPTDQKSDRPTGPRTFSLDLTRLKS